jgi:apolipoprotein N-acyltransferase
LFLFSLLFGLTEFLRGNILTGFPWNLIVFSFSENLEILQILSFVGTYGFNIFCVSLFASPSIFILRENSKEVLVCIIFFIITNYIFFRLAPSNMSSFQSLKSFNNDYVIRTIGTKINLDRFYGNTDTAEVITELIKISQPDKETKTIFLWPEGIIPNINQKQLKEFEFLFSEKFNENHLLAIGINSYEQINEKDYFYNTLSIYDHKFKPN